MKLSNSIKKKLQSYIILEKNDYDKLELNQLLQFYNPENKILCSGRFIEFHTENFIKVLNYYKDERVYTISKFVIYYKPKINKERKFMENLLYNDIFINKLV